MPGLVQRSPTSTLAASSFLSVGQVMLHDNLRCDILRSPIVHLGSSKSLMHGQPTFAMSRMTLQLQFVNIEPEPSNANSPYTRSALEYVDARIHLSSSMHLDDSEALPEPLHLADSLAGDKHYERILRAGTALLEDLKTANENREEHPKPSNTGGFLVREGGSPIVGMLGTQWLDGPDRFYGKQSRPPGRRTHERNKSTSTVASAPLEPIYENSCIASHWEGEPSGSGTETVVLQLRPLTKCPSCGTNPLQLLHAASKRAATPSSARTPTSLRSHEMQLVPNKAFKLVVNLLSYDQDTADVVSSSEPSAFFAHFKISFYFTDDRAQVIVPGRRKSHNHAKECCPLKRHNFSASIEIGKEGDAKLRQKKEVDFSDALAKLEGKGAKTDTPVSRRPTAGARLFTT